MIVDQIRFYPDANFSCESHEPMNVGVGIALFHSAEHFVGKRLNADGDRVDATRGHVAELRSRRSRFGAHRALEAHSDRG